MFVYILEIRAYNTEGYNEVVYITPLVISLLSLKRQFERIFEVQ